MVSGQNAIGQNANVCYATDFCVWGLGVGVLGLGRAFLVLGFWVLAFWHWCFVPRSLSIGKMLFPQVTTRSPSRHLSSHIQVHCYSTFYQ